MALGPVEHGALHAALHVPDDLLPVRAADGPGAVHHQIRVHGACQPWAKAEGAVTAGRARARGRHSAAQQGPRQGGGGSSGGTPLLPGSGYGPRQRAGTNFFGLNPLGTEGAKANFWLSASNIGRGGEGEGGYPPPPTVNGHSNTSLAPGHSWKPVTSLVHKASTSPKHSHPSRATGWQPPKARTTVKAVETAETTPFVPTRALLRTL